ARNPPRWSGSEARNESAAMASASAASRRERSLLLRILPRAMARNLSAMPILNAGASLAILRRRFRKIGETAPLSSASDDAPDGRTRTARASAILSTGHGVNTCGRAEPGAQIPVPVCVSVILPPYLIKHCAEWCSEQYRGVQNGRRRPLRQQGSGAGQWPRRC